jgi:DNA-binding NarL/FixJ family response regulator
MKVLVVDDNDLFRQRTCALLERVEDITVVGEAKDGQRAIALIRETCPDIVLLGIGTPQASNLQMVVQIGELFPHIKIIVLNDEDQEQLVLEALKRGALGHLVKGKTRPAEIVEAIRAVGKGEAILSPGVAGCMLDEYLKKLKDP